MSSVICQSGKNPHRGTPRMEGFTLIELMITLGIAIILAAIAVPQYHNTMQTQVTVAEITDLSNAMQYARSEAIKEGQMVSACVSTDHKTCTGTLWNQGWIVYANPTSAAVFDVNTSILLQTKSGFTSTDTIATGPTAAVAVVNYNRDGFAVNVSSGTGLLFTLHTSPVNSVATRCLWISSIGNQFIQVAGTAAATGQGTNKCV